MGRHFWTFKKARSYVRKLNFRTSTEWKEYACSGEMPITIPTNPNIVYKDDGWSGYRDWLTDTRSLVKGRYKKFKSARAFARSLKLKKESDWPAYAASGQKPDDIPSCPERVYADLGWKNRHDWLGLKKQTRGPFLPYDDAKKYVHRLNLETKSEWKEYVSSGKLPPNIPNDPYTAYRYKGYKSMGDWLGTDYVSTRDRSYKTFTKARAWVRKQKLKTVQEWYDFSRSGALPDDIPRTPDAVYKKSWQGMPDWLGNKNESPLRYRPERNPKINRNFKSARAFVRRLKLKSAQEWEDYTRYGQCPIDIPSIPSHVYDEWISMKDWLGLSKK